MIFFSLFSILTFLSLYLTLNRCIFFISDIFTPSHTLNVEKSTDVDRHHIGYWFVSVRIHKPHFNNLRNFAVQVFFTLPYSNQNYQNIIKEWVSLIDYLVLNYHQCYIWYKYLCFITKKYYELRPFCFDFVLKQCYTNFQNIPKHFKVTWCIYFAG